MEATTALAVTAEETDAASTQFVAKGRESASRLLALLGQAQLQAAGSSTLHGPVRLAERILRCFDRALAALHGERAGTEEDDDDAAGSDRKLKRQCAVDSASSKRIRRNAGGWEARVETKPTMHDNFLWRKYGQKDIKNSKHPRFYYRCSYKHEHGCTAAKQVQQSEADPSVYVITYFGEHTCGHRVEDDSAAAAAVDGGDEESLQAHMVIGFGTPSGRAAGGASASWPCSGDDDSGTSQPWEEEEIPACTEQPIEESPPLPELMGMVSSPDREPLLDQNLLDLQLGESSFDIDELFDFDDELAICLIDNASY